MALMKKVTSASMLNWYFTASPERKAVRSICVETRNYKFVLLLVGGGTLHRSTRTILPMYICLQFVEM